MGPNDVTSFVAARLRALRLERGLSLRQLAKRSDLSPEMLSRAERGERTPTVETLARACSGLGVSLSAFFSEHRLVVEAREPVAVVAVAAPPIEKLKLAVRDIERVLETIRAIDPALARGGRRPREQA
jgi:transcriptional regulator with XRE-family HTH domain